MAKSNLPDLDPRHPRWNNGRIRSSLGAERWAFLGFTVVWNGLIHTALWAVVLKKQNTETLAIAAIGFFALIGLLLIYQTAVKWLQWRRFGGVELHMDPFPGSIGGEIGGSIDVPLRYAPDSGVEVKLSCIQVTVTRGHKGKSKRSERVLWREQATIKGEPGMRGTRFRFKFPVPADLRASEEPSDNYIKWMLHVGRELKGADIDHSFELLVEDDGAPRLSSIRNLDAVQSSDVAQLDDKLVRLEKRADGMRLFYPASRGRSAGLVMFVFGSVFLGVPVFFIDKFSEFGGGGFAIVFQLFGGFFGLIFGLIGLAIVLFAVYSIFNSLSVDVTSRGVSSVRRVLGLSARTDMSLDEIKSLSYSISGQTGSGATASVEYRLEALSEGAKTLCLGDGIKGKPLADRLMRELSAVLKIEQWKQGERKRRLRKRMQS